METNDPAYEWELSKENVQPLKTGRKFSNLTAALCPSSADRHGKIKEEKQKFELELRTYSGDDPLSVWYEYILWTEQNFPSGARMQLSQLLEKCVTQYKDEEKYKNDSRYLEIWIKFARMCTDPLEIYNFMYTQTLCSRLAAFYEAWASELESVGNTKRADAIYKQGLEQGAQPGDWLMTRHRDFQSRVAHRLATGEDMPMEVGSNQTEQDAENRGSLSVIRGHGRNKKVGSTRTPSSRPAVLEAARSTRSSSNVQGPSFTIFEEKDSRPTTSLPPQSKQWTSVPVRSQVNRENELKPGKWTEAKVRQRTGFNTETPTAPAFQIHEDPNTPQPDITPRKVNPDINLVLSARKPAKPHDPLQALTALPGESKQVAMYCKHLVYVGAEEFSLEEIRAASMQKKQELQRQKQLEEERQKMEEQLRAQREQLAAVMEQKQQIEQEVQQYRSSSMMEVGESQTTEPVPTALPAANTSEHELSASDSMSTQRLLAFRLSSGSINEPGSCSLSDRSAFKSRTPDLSSHSGQQPIIPTPNNKTSSRNASIAAPSPTVNTKDAMRLVMGLFNQSIHTDRDVGSTCHKPAQPLSNPMPAAAAFTIFEDKPQKPTSGKEEDEENAENRPPTGYQNGPRRQDLAGVLQPSKDVPFEPLADPMDEGEDGDILAQPLQDEPMDCMDGGAEFGDLTFAPYCSSTRNFTGLAKLAAATFSDTVDARRQSLAAPALDMSNVSARKSCQNGSSTLHGQSAAQSVSVSSENRTIGEKTRTDGFGLSNLSTITERSSDDDPKMAATTLTTKEASHFQAHTSKEASHFQAHTSKASTTKDTSLQLQLETSSFSHTTHNPTSSQLTPDDSWVRADTSRQQTMTPINQTCHEIDVSHYVPADDVADLLSQSVMVNPDHDPFDAELIREFLAGLERPIESYPTYHAVNESLPAFRVRTKVPIGTKCYDVIQRLGEGAYAKVYEIRRDRSEDPSSESRVVKVQTPACPWEFYITSELNRRLDQQASPLGPAVMSIDEAYIYKDGSCFISELLPHGTLLDVINTVRVAGQTLPEPLAVLLAIHVLRILEGLMAANIIHGDIKPDNFLFRGFPLLPNGSCDVPAEPSLQLIDFGRSIDMKMFPRGTTFSVGVETSGFQCVEMTTGRPWTYQTDMFGVVGTLNVIIFGTYMKVALKNGRWKPNSNFKRWFKSQRAMSQLFDELLNVSSCEQLPDVRPLRTRLEDDFRRLHASKYNGCVRSFMAGLR